MTDERRRLRVSDLDDETFVELDPPAAEDPPATTTEPPPPGVEPPTAVAPLRADKARARTGGGYEVVAGGWRFRLTVDDAHRARLRDRARRAAAEHSPAAPQMIKAQIPGRIVSVEVVPGDQVTVGQRLLAVEAMKMENEVRAPRAGTVEAVLVTVGTRVELGDELVRIV